MELPVGDAFKVINLPCNCWRACSDSQKLDPVFRPEPRVGGYLRCQQAAWFCSSRFQGPVSFKLITAFYLLMQVALRARSTGNQDWVFTLVK
jgi:hypothetical protein